MRSIVYKPPPARSRALPCTIHSLKCVVARVKATDSSLPLPVYSAPLPGKSRAPLVNLTPPLPQCTLSPPLAVSRLITSTLSQSLYSIYIFYLIVRNLLNYALILSLEMKHS